MHLHFSFRSVISKDGESRGRGDAFRHSMTAIFGLQNALPMRLAAREMKQESRPPMRKRDGDRNNFRLEKEPESE